MEYAKRVILSILNEEAIQTDVIDAIKKKYLVNITYDDGANGQRLIEPVIYGKTRKGNLVVRAYQPNGDTRSSIPSWKLFRLDLITSWMPRKNEHFDEPPMYHGQRDEMMTIIYPPASDFSNSNIETTPQQVTSQQNRTIANGNGDNNGASYGINNSVRDMSQVKDFGDRNTTQTTGPVMDGNVDNNANNNQNVDYSRIKDNGPVYKDDDNNAEDLENS